MTKYLFSFGLALICACVFNVTGPVHATDGLAKDQPVNVGSCKGKKKDGNPESPISTSGKTVADGGFGMDLKNTSNNNVRDVHIRVDSPEGAKIRTAIWAGTPPAFVTMTTLPASTLVAHGDLANGSTTAVDLIIEDKDGNVLNNKDVKLSIWWSRGVDHNIWVSATSPDTIGDGDPMVTLVSLEIPDYNVDVVEVEDGVDEADLNMIVLAECHSFRFQKGSLVLSTNGNQKFAMGHLDGEDLVVAAWDEDGEQVTSQQRVSFSNPRIDVRGNFVVDVERNQDDDLHLVIVITNLRLTGLDSRDFDAPVKVSFSGAAIGGGCLHDLYDIAIVTSD
jgi:hypothetical protein